MTTPSTLCGNCGRSRQDDQDWTTVIDWRTDQICKSCFDSYEWSDQDWMIDTLSRTYRRKSRDDQAWIDAYYITWIGASNPKGVARTLAQHSSQLGDDHPAVRAIKGHLDYLNGNGLGPELDELREVERNARRLGLVS